MKTTNSREAHSPRKFMEHRGNCWTAKGEAAGEERVKMLCCLPYVIPKN
ncbi:hypothetical protein IH879_11785 [candidate division KSB1 bacterium]|nr:hypothetical protein [candidate division KSB1 bacterium]